MVILHDFKHKKGSSEAFQWRGRWSKEDKEGLWTEELKQALDYAEIYGSTQSYVAMPFSDFISLFNSTVLISGLDKSDCGQISGLTGAQCSYFSQTKSQEYYVTMASKNSARCRMIAAEVIPG